MRKLLITIAAAASALAVAAPASAQYFPQQQGNAYGYNNYGQARRLQARIDRLQGDLDRLAQRGAISRREHRNLHGESHAIESRLRAASRYGLDPRERYNIEMRIARLEQRIVYEVRDGRNGRNGYGNGDYHGYGSGGSYDQDRDGRDDRYEDDRGRDHDGRRGHDDDDD
ncbi:MAG: hypothetical protein ABIO43_08935 [Sphingomicrobium sp.]